MGGMEEPRNDAATKLSRREISAAVTGLGWRLLIGEIRADVVTGSLPLAADVAARAAALPGADGHLRMDVRSDRVTVAVRTAAADWVTPHDIELARRISALADGLGLAAGGPDMPPRTVQMLEIAIDALDIPAVMPFWKAVLDYAEGPGGDDLAGPLRHRVSRDGSPTTAHGRRRRPCCGGRTR